MSRKETTMVLNNGCPSQNTPLRDTYISATEPVWPFHSNFVLINLLTCAETTPAPNNIPGDVLNLQGKSTLGAANTYRGIQIWKSPSFGQEWNWNSKQTFYQNTHGVRTWSNTGFWYNPPHYCTDNATFVPHSRSRKCPEAQYGDALFLHALLNGMGYLEYQGSTDYDTIVPAQLTSTTSGSVNNLRNQYKKFNDLADPASINPFALHGLPNVAGLNLTLFNIRAVKTAAPGAAAPAPAATAGVGSCDIPPCIPQCIVSSAGRAARFATRFGTPTQPALIITIWPLISGTSANTPQINDWDGVTEGEFANFVFANPDTAGIQPLPTIQYRVHPRQKCFYVTLPVQLYTLTSVGPTAPNITFTKQDILYNTEPTAAKPTIEVLAVKLKGTFTDITGLHNVTAAFAAGIKFEIVSPSRTQRCPVQLTLSYQENTAKTNRPIYCFEGVEGGYPDEAIVPIIPVFDSTCTSVPFNPSLLFTPKCAPGIWTNFNDPFNPDI